MQVSRFFIYCNLEPNEHTYVNPWILDSNKGSLVEHYSERVALIDTRLSYDLWLYDGYVHVFDWYMWDHYENCSTLTTSAYHKS